MPKSKVRKKSVYTPPAEAMGPAKGPVAGPSHPLYVGVMLGLMVLGLLWLVVNYLAVDRIPLLNSLGSLADTQEGLGKETTRLKEKLKGAAVFELILDKTVKAMDGAA